MNDYGLAIALHHGSRDGVARRKVEDAMRLENSAALCALLSIDPRRRLGRRRSRHQCRRAQGASRLMHIIFRANHTSRLSLRVPC